MRTAVSTLAVGAMLLLGVAPSGAIVRSGSGGRGDVGSPACLQVQRAAQDSVRNGGPYRNHGALVGTAAHVVGAAAAAGAITEECASCIMNQFARGVPIEQQGPCGEERPRQVADLRGPETTACDGPSVGATSIQELSNGDIEFRLVFTAGPPSSTFDVFWICTTIPNGCHNSTCGGYVGIGDVTTSATGQALFVTTIPGGNPFPGEYVHIDLCLPGCAGSVYTSVFGQIPAAAAAKPGLAVAPGDPRASAPAPERTWSLVKEIYR